MKKIHLFTVCAMCMILFLASLGSAEELRILCWEGYAPPEYTEAFEGLVKERYLEADRIRPNVFEFLK